MKEIRKILVPVDFSDNSQKILESGVFFAEKCDASLEVIYVVQSLADYSGFFVPHTPISTFEDEMKNSAEQKMESFLKDYPDVSATVLTGDVAEEIVEYAKKAACDLIVMGTHGYKGLERVMFGSIADKVVKTAPCPVLTINPYKDKG
jgi:nucleotide-binding universal stress UspA family protein